MSAGGPAGGSAVSLGDWVLLGVLLAVMVLTNRADAVLRRPGPGPDQPSLAPPST